MKAIKLCLPSIMGTITKGVSVIGDPELSREDDVLEKLMK